MEENKFQYIKEKHFKEILYLNNSMNYKPIALKLLQLIFLI